MTVSAASRPRFESGRVLWALTGAGWAVLVALSLAPGGMVGMPAMSAAGLAGGGRPLGPLLAEFTAGWLVMVAAMMLPTTVPFARMFGAVTARQGTRVGLAGFFGAYVLVWLAFGAAGLAAAASVARLAPGARPELVLSGALAVAGAFQFSPLKTRCLTLCRDPRAFLFGHYRRGGRGALALGMRHALSCLGCCWALMLVMFATGVGGLIWMLALTAVMVAEKVTRWGHRLAAPVGVALLIAAVLVAVIGVGPGTPMPMPMK